MVTTLILVLFLFVVFPYSFLRLSRVYMARARTDISRFFRNKRIKTYLHDKYIFYKNLARIKKSSRLFLVLGSESDQCLADLLPEQNILQDFRDRADPFGVYSLKDTTFIFLSEKALEKDTESVRLGFFLDRLVRECWHEELLSGVLWLCPESVFNAQKPVTKEFREQVENFALIFSEISRKMGVRLPLIFIERFQTFLEEGDSTIHGVSDYLSTNDDELDESQDSTRFFSQDIPNQSLVTNQVENDFKAGIAFYTDGLEKNLLKTSKKDQSQPFNTMSLVYRSKKSVFLLYNKVLTILLPKIENIWHIPSNISLLQTFQFPQSHSDEISPRDIDSISESHDNVSLSPVLDHLAFSKELPPLYTNEQVVDQKRLKIRVLYGVLVLLGILSLFFSYKFISITKIFQSQAALVGENLAHLKKQYFSAQTSYTENTHLNTDVCTFVASVNTFDQSMQQYSYLGILWPQSFLRTTMDDYKRQFIAEYGVYLGKILQSKINYFSNESYVSSTKNSTEALEKVKEVVSVSESANNVLTIVENKNSMDDDRAYINLAESVAPLGCKEQIIKNKTFSNFNVENLKNLENYVKSAQPQLSTILMNVANSYLYKNYEDNELIKNLVLMNNQLNKFYLLYEESQETSPELFRQRNEAVNLLLQSYSQLKTRIGTNNALNSLAAFLGQDYVALLNKAKEMKFFSPEALQAVAQNEERFYQVAKQQIATLNTSELGNSMMLRVVVATEEGKIELDPSFTQFMSALHDMRSLYTTDQQNDQLSFIEFTATLNNSVQLQWAVDKLQSSLQKGLAFEKVFSTVRFEQYSSQASQILELYASELTLHFWDDQLARAVFVGTDLGSSPLSSGKLSGSSQQLITSLGFLRTLRQILAKYDLIDLEEELDNVLSLQVNTALAQIYTQLKNRAFFIADSRLSSWNGSHSAAYLAYGADSDEALKTYITATQAQMQDFYIKNASSLVDAAMNYGGTEVVLDSDYLNRWIAIKKALENPANSASNYQKLTEFIQKDMNTLRTGNCAIFLTAWKNPSIGQDYFSDELSRIYNELAGRCKVLYSGYAIESYNSLANRFNQQLSEKFPFSRKPNLTEYADLSNVQTILKQLAEMEKNEIPFLEKVVPSYINSSSHRNFISELRSVHDFIIAQNPNFLTDGILSFSLEFKFRNIQNDEILANQIANWELQIGDQRHGSLYGQLRSADFDWTYGNRMRFTVTLAESAKFTFAKRQEDTNVFIDTKNVSFVFNNSWSIFQFMEKYRSSSDKYSLRFVIPTSTGQNMVFFVGIDVADSQGDRWDLPAFPARAPLLE